MEIYIMLKVSHYKMLAFISNSILLFEDLGRKGIR